VRTDESEDGCLRDTQQNTPAEVFQPGLMQLGERSVPVKGLDTYVTVQTSYSLGQILHVGRHSIVQRATHNATGILVTTKRPITVGKKMFEKYAREVNVSQMIKVDPLSLRSPLISAKTSSFCRFWRSVLNVASY
jgi:hypothetical protein